MRRIARALLFVAITAIPAEAQDGASGVPRAVDAALREKYSVPGAAKWTHNSDNTYRANLSRSGTVLAVTFTASGQWIETMTEMGAINLPEPVRKNVVRDFKGFRFVQTFRIDRSDDSAPVFEIHLSSKDGAKTIRYRSDGSVVKANAKTSLAKPARPL